MRSHRLMFFGAALLCGGVYFFGVATPVNADDAAGTFKTKCAVCHGAGGKGDTPAGKSMSASDLTKSAASKSAEDLKGTIEKGRNKMPAYGKSLKPGEIDSLVAYIKSLK